MWPLADYSPVNGSLRPLPSIKRQAVFFATGALAGTSAVPIEVLYQHFTSSAKRHDVALRYLAPPIAYRAGVRFWTFDLAKSQLEHTSTPAWLRGAIPGALGGFAEVSAQSVIQRKIPDPAAVEDQTAKLSSASASVPISQRQEAQEVRL
ncbi:ras-related GTP-binding protein C [Physcia stellaris]|nr:ras-related GTP-binding protein C [Physcia stellaris]